MSNIDDLKRIIKEHEQRILKLENLFKQGKKPQRKKSTSVASLIEGLKDDGFFNDPKNLNEIRLELAKNNYHYSVTSLTNPLQRLVRQRVLGRMLQNRRWAYVKR